MPAPVPMPCLKCGGDSRIYDSRPNGNGSVWRRRECNHCETQWSTREYADDHPDIAQLDDILESMRVVHQAMGRTIKRVEEFIKGKESQDI